MDSVRLLETGSDLPSVLGLRVQTSNVVRIVRIILVSSHSKFSLYYRQRFLFRCAFFNIFHPLLLYNSWQALHGNGVGAGVGSVCTSLKGNSIPYCWGLLANVFAHSSSFILLLLLRISKFDLHMGLGRCNCWRWNQRWAGVCLSK